MVIFKKNKRTILSFPSKSDQRKRIFFSTSLHTKNPENTKLIFCQTQNLWLQANVFINQDDTAQLVDLYKKLKDLQEIGSVNSQGLFTSNTNHIDIMHRNPLLGCIAQTVPIMGSQPRSHTNCYKMRINQFFCPINDNGLFNEKGLFAF